MTERGSVTIWIERLKAGESSAAEPLYATYFRRLVDLARQQLRGLRGAPADEEDVALSTFDSFCRAARFAAYQQALGDRFQPRVLPDSCANPNAPMKNPHSVVTLHLIDEQNQPTRKAVE